MLIRVKQNSMGHLTLSPVNKRKQAEYAKHLQRFDKHADGTVYMQLDYEIDKLLASMGSKGKAILKGYYEIIRMDDWEFATMLGYDANTI